MAKRKPKKSVENNNKWIVLLIVIVVLSLVVNLLSLSVLNSIAKGSNGLEGELRSVSSYAPEGSSGHPRCYSGNVGSCPGGGEDFCQNLGYTGPSYYNKYLAVVYYTCDDTWCTMHVREECAYYEECGNSEGGGYLYCYTPEGQEDRTS